MFKFEKDKQYMMPAHFGPRVAGRGSARYGDVISMSVSYLTDGEMLAQYLPEPFEVGQEPLLTVSYSMNREIDWLAGGSYNIIGVNASAVFNGEVDHLEGGFCLVMWENLTDPILTGRELQGIPKIYADIEDHTIIHGEWRTCASYRGHKIVDMVVRDLKPLSEEQIRAAAKAREGWNWMGWKYIPNTGGPGAEVSYPTLFPTTGELKEAWAGIGEVAWHRLTWEQNPTQCHIVNALEALPIIEYRSAVVSRSSSNLAVPSRPVRRLR